MAVRLEELAEEVRKLNELLQDPHPGLAMWQEASRNQGRKVKELLKEALPDSDD